MTVPKIVINDPRCLNKMRTERGIVGRHQDVPHQLVAFDSTTLQLGVEGCHPMGWREWWGGFRFGFKEKSFHQCSDLLFLLGDHELVTKRCERKLTQVDRPLLQVPHWKFSIGDVDD
jgi:hypothetical protein